MTAAVSTAPGLASRLVNGVLAIKPLAYVAKHQARQMMIKRAEKIGVPWTQEVQTLAVRHHEEQWQRELAQLENPQISYPDYYLTSFHAYDTGNLSWQAAFELRPAARAVHAKIWGDIEPQGDAKLRQTYHDILKDTLDYTPQNILDVGCGVGLSTFALQDVYPQSRVTGLDLSPYFLAVAQYRAQESHYDVSWVHGAAESTGLPDAGFDLVSTCLMCHELPQSATQKIFREMQRILRPGGYLTIMDMNPQSEIYKKMPPYILTLLKSTEPYLDQYFALDIGEALVAAGFNAPRITNNTPRHRTIIAQKKG